VIYDCFPFFNELELLELRLHELAPVVDRHVLVEATVTHSGQPKPLHFADNEDPFRHHRPDYTFAHVEIDETFRTTCVADATGSPA
jgi:beta-1,4-mannosyl-glycoprotein beta-1,4-N-acetylglucosaminyltransferase